MQTDDSCVVFTEVQLSRRGHHAIADVPICAASGDVEISRQNCTWEANDNLVADFEVACAANDAANVLATVSGLLAFCCNANLAPANGLAVALRLRDELENLTNNHWAGYAESVRSFFF